MLRVIVTPPAETERRWLEHNRARVRSELDRRPTVVMADEAASMLDQREFIYRRRGYRVPPVPWPLAVRLLAVQDEMRLAAGNPEKEAAAFASAIRLIKSACRPANLIRRLFWRLLPNPWRDATPREVGLAVGFFCACQSMDAVASPRTTLDLLGTSPPRSPGSSAPIRNGRARTGIRSPGRIS